MIEFLGGFFAFWIWMFSPTFRARVREEWRDGGGIQRGGLIFDGFVAVLFGVLLPACLLFYVATR